MSQPVRPGQPLADSPPAETPQEVAEVTDAEAITLVLRYQRGDREALEALHGRLEPIMWSFLRRYGSGSLPSTVTYQDLGQQCWLMLAELAARWRPPGSFLAYFFKSFPRDLRRFLQYSGLNRRPDLVQVISLPHHEVVTEAERLTATPPPDAGPSWPDSLDVLSENQRAAFVLRAAEGCSFAEIGRALGTSQATAHRLYQQALAQVRGAAGRPGPQVADEPSWEALRLVRALHAMAGRDRRVPGRRRVLAATGVSRGRYLALLEQLVAVGAIVDRGATAAGRLVDPSVEATLERLKRMTPHPSLRPLGTAGARSEAGECAPPPLGAAPVEIPPSS